MPENIHRPLVPLPALLADIGGTNARFALLGEDGLVGATAKVLVRNHPSPGAAFREAILPLLPTPPRSAVFALAGQIHGDRAPLTNGAWVVEPLRLIAEDSFDEVVILNDFEAVSLSLPSLSPDDEVRIGGGTAEPDATRLAIGPGTGLGASALLRVDGRWVPIGGEGGHVDLGPRTDVDFAVWPHLERISGRVSAEWLLSGPGLLRLGRAVALSEGVVCLHDTPAGLAKAGLAGIDAIARQTLDLFATYLGRFAGDLAVTFLPAGGVHIAGGIAPTMLDVLRQGSFRRAFVDKAPHRAIMERIATSVITHPAAALLGIAALILRPDEYAVNLHGRHWR